MITLGTKVTHKKTGFGGVVTGRVEQVDRPTAVIVSVPVGTGRKTKVEMRFDEAELVDVKAPAPVKPRRRPKAADGTRGSAAADSAPQSIRGRKSAGGGAIA